MNPVFYFVPLCDSLRNSV